LASNPATVLTWNILDALDAALDRALHLGLDPVRDTARSTPAGAFTWYLPSAEAGVWVRGGFGAPCRRPVPPNCDAPDAASLDLVELRLDRLQPLRHADHLPPGSAGFMLTRIFLHQLAENCFARPR